MISFRFKRGVSGAPGSVPGRILFGGAMFQGSTIKKIIHHTMINVTISFVSSIRRFQNPFSFQENLISLKMQWPRIPGKDFVEVLVCI